MDAETRSTIAVERLIEPLSGLEILRVSGFWQAPNSLRAPDRIDVRYDEQVAVHCHLAIAEAADIPLGYTRLNFGTQLPTEAGKREVSVVSIERECEVVLYRRPWSEVGIEPAIATPSFASRVWQSLISGEILSPSRWKARVSRLLDKLLELRLKVRYRLLARRFRPRSTHDAYVENTAITPRMRQAMLDAISNFHHKPTFSILVPVYNVEPRWLKEAIDSVRAQTYPHWELCLADDCSTNPELIRYLENLPNDPRI